jgi:synaptic vesicle membrane protein VAT-1
MKKVVVHSPGGYGKLRIEEHPDPTPQQTEVVVQTDAVGISYADCCVRWGVYESAWKFVGWPITPGFEFAGTVVAAGPRATHAVGSRVFGITRFGGYSTHVAVPSHQVWPLPAAMTAEQAAGFTGNYMTAYHAVFQLVRARKGSKALVHSAAGGVGTCLLQICRVAEVKTLAVVGGPHKVEVARRFGAHEVVDKSRENLWRAAKRWAPDGFDLVFDANGYTTLRGSYRHLATTGKLIAYGTHAVLPKEGGRINFLKTGLGLARTPWFNPLELVSANKSIIGFNVSFLFHREDLLEEGMSDLLRWLDEGKIQPPAVTTFPFERVADAHRLIESGQSVGKLVLVHGR